MLQWMRPGPRGTRADLPDPVADGDHAVEALIEELVEVLGPPARQVDAVGLHHPHRVRMQASRLAAGAERLHAAVGEVLEQGLGHLRTGAVLGAEEEDPSRTTPPGTRGDLGADAARGAAPRRRRPAARRSA